MLAKLRYNIDVCQCTKNTHQYHKTSNPSNLALNIVIIRIIPMLANSSNLALNIRDRPIKGSKLHSVTLSSVPQLHDLSHHVSMLHDQHSYLPHEIDGGGQ